MQIPDAYNAVPGPDGLLAYGGSHETFVRFPDGRTVSTPGACAGWSGREVVVSRGVELSPNVYGRDLVFVSVDTLREWSSNLDPAQQPGWFPQIAHVHDLTVSSVDGGHFLNGQLIPTEPGAGKIEDFDGEHILYPVQRDGAYTFVVKRLSDGVYWHRVPFYLSNARIDRMAMGVWLSANVDGRMVAWSPDGVRYDGPQGEGRGLVTALNGEIVMVTAISEGWTPLWLFRPLSEWRKDAPAWILRDIGHQGMKIADGQAMGYNESERGKLTVLPVPYDQPREVYAPPKSTLPVITVPPMPPMLVGYLTEKPEAPGNTGAVGSGKPFIIEGFRQDGSPWFTGIDQVDVIYVDLKESKNPAVMLARAKAEQDRRRNWLVFYSDSHLVADDHNGDLWTLAEARKCQAEGRPVLLGIRCYLAGPQDTYGNVFNRVGAEVLKYRDEFPLVLFLAAYNQSGNWPDSEVIVSIGNVALLAGHYSASLRGIVFFGWQRPPVIPEIDAAAKAVCDAVPLPIRETIVPSWPMPKPIDDAPPPNTNPFGKPLKPKPRGFMARLFTLIAKLKNKAAGL